MSRTPRDKLDREVERVHSLADGGGMDDRTRDLLLEWSVALDDGTVQHKYRDEYGDVKTLSPSTVTDYLMSLRKCCERGLYVADCSAAEFNSLMDRLHDDDGLTKGTLAKYQCAAETFYRYHDLGVDPDDIHVFTPDSTPMHDETDMFEEAEVDALRAACGETNSPVRNRAFLELLIFTGQRIRAIVTLRLQDVDVQEGYIYLNDDYDDSYGGLKGALERGRKRPMFGARKFVRDHVEYNRSNADPDDYLFVGDLSHPMTDPDGHWTGANQMLGRLGKNAGADKPVNPHNFRHYCATVLKREYDLDSDTIKMLLGHVEGSATLRETYQHLFDQDYIDKAESALGYREEDETPSFTPEACPTCGELLDRDWRRCPNCEEVFGPTDDFEEQLEDTVERARDEGLESIDPETIAVAKAISDVGGDTAALAERLAEIDS